MLVELSVRDLGVVSHLQVVFGPGMSALTGETGAGKTLVVEAIGLLLGDRADPDRVRPGAAEAVVEGRFVTDAGEVVLTRVVPGVGRSRCYVDGRLATAASVAELGGSLIEIHGQHSQQSLLRSRAQRDALDRFGTVDTGPLRAARERVRLVEAALDALGGDERARARELDLVRFQLSEIDAARVSDPDEDELLSNEEDILGAAVELRSLTAEAALLLGSDEGAADLAGRAGQLLDGHPSLASRRERLTSLTIELADLAGDLRDASDAAQEDPERLDEIRGRRQLLADLRRKYGPTLTDVIEFGTIARARVDELAGHEARAATLESERATAVAARSEASAATLAARVTAAPALAAAIEERLGEVGMGAAHVEIAVEGEAGDDIDLRIATNPGMPMAPLSKVASGGELSRVMLALHQVLSAGPPTMVFDEVDAGIGGVTAAAVGRSLARVARERQVVVVTHLPQVAACADGQISVQKAADGAMTTTTALVLDHEGRVIELARMLSGSPDSEVAQGHARELLDASALGGGRAR